MDTFPRKTGHPRDGTLERGHEFRDNNSGNNSDNSGNRNSAQFRQFECLRGRNAGYPSPPRTVPDARFSRIRFLGCTRFRVKRVLSSISSAADFGYARPRYLYPVENLLELRPIETLPLSSPAVELFEHRPKRNFQEDFQRYEVSSHPIVIEEKIDLSRIARLYCFPVRFGMTAPICYIFHTANNCRIAQIMDSAICSQLSVDRPNPNRIVW